MPPWPLVARTATAARYRMVSLPTTPPKPGVVRDEEHGASLEVEVWALDPAGFGSFVDEIPAPLAIGTVELADGTWVNGFVCEAHAQGDIVDRVVTAFQGALQDTLDAQAQGRPPLEGHGAMSHPTAG